MPANVLLSLACAMQVESFRKIRGVPCATTMCIGNLRGGTEHLFLYLRTGDPEARRKSLHYYGIILIFAVGASLGAAATLALGTGAIWLAAALLLLLDEPFHALDEDTRRQMERLLEEETAGCLVLLVTHHPVPEGARVIRLESGPLSTQAPPCGT